MSSEQRTGEPAEAVFGPFRLVPGRRLLERNGTPVEVGGRALDILIELVKRAGEVVSKADLMSTIWADTTVVEGVLRTHVYNLRKALRDGVAGARYVTSVAGLGYCFVAPVVRTVTAAASQSWKLAHGLPPRLGRMTGRDETVQTLIAQLRQHRFVTVLGAAGIGKTTVAVAVGHALLEELEGAVRYVELESLTEPAHVASTIAAMFGVPVEADDTLERLQAFLGDKRVLLVFDNCEHVVDAVATVAEYLFLRAPHLHILTTSREALRVEGEHTHRLGSLETPTDVHGMSAATLEAFPAVQILLERAAASGWSGELADDDVPIVAEACRRLDGVPRALELAATFIAERGVHGLPAALDDRCRLLLQHGHQKVPPRQQTLDALIAWSYDRLLERERIVLRRLAVFVGTFPLDAASAVAASTDSDESVPEIMNELTAKSLLSATVRDGAVVYRLLETTRCYALERLAESGELAQVRLRHASFLVTAAHRASYLADVRAALHWSLSSCEGHATGARLLAVAAPMLLELGLAHECLQWSRRALEVIAKTDVGTDVELCLQEGSALSEISSKGHTRDARIALTRGVEIARALGGGEREVRLLERLCVFLMRAGDLRGAVDAAQQSVGAARAGTSEAITSQWMLGSCHYMSGNFPEAEAHCEAGMRLAEESGHAPRSFLGYTHASVVRARTPHIRGHADRAKAIALRFVDEATELGNPFDACFVLMNVVPVLVWRGDWGEAERLLDFLDEHVDQYSLATLRGMVVGLRGDLLVKLGRSEEGAGLLRVANSLAKQARSQTYVTIIGSAFAEALTAIGSYAEALALIEQVVADAAVRGDMWLMPELLRIKGTLLALSSEHERAWHETLSSAIALARQQGALTWELHATIALAQARRSAEDLHDLSVVVAKFEEGMEAPSFQAARRLLGTGTSSRTTVIPIRQRS